MYLEKIAHHNLVIAILILAVLIIAFFYYKVRIDCIKKDKLIKSQLCELSSQAMQIERLTALYSHALGIDKSKTDFFTSVAHELKTPVSVILGASQLICLKTELQPDSNPFLLKNMKIIRTNCYRLMRLVNNLLDFSRADAGFLKLNPANCNLSDTVRDIMHSVIPFAQQKHISFEFDTENPEIVTAIDPDKFERIILNLLSNAIKFTPEDGKITVRIAERENKAVISVKDTGIGIPKEKQEDIFRKYVQAGSLAASEHEGSGIGLWIVNAFVDLHKGNIRVISEPMQGSEFIIELPVKIMENAANCSEPQTIKRDKLAQAVNMEFTAI